MREAVKGSTQPPTPQQRRALGCGWGTVPGSAGHKGPRRRTLRTRGGDNKEVRMIRDLMWGTVLVAVAVMTFVGYIALFN